MVKNNQTVLIANTLADVFYHVNSVRNLQIVGGCTAVDTINDTSLTVRNIKELLSIEKKERFFEFGPAVTLASILNLGKTKLPSIFYDTVSSVATPFIRNLATIGGNICAEGQKHTLYAPLLALDARLEIRSKDETKFISLNNFNGIPHGYVLTKIRIPVEDWSIAIFRRVGPSNLITPLSASFAFLADMQKDILLNIKIVFAGTIIFKSHELENKLIGTRLPLSSKNIDSLIQESETEFVNQTENQTYEPILKDQFLNLLRYSFEQLS